MLSLAAVIKKEIAVLHQLCDSIAALDFACAPEPLAREVEIIEQQVAQWRFLCEQRRHLLSRLRPPPSSEVELGVSAPAINREELGDLVENWRQARAQLQLVSSERIRLLAYCLQLNKNLLQLFSPGPETYNEQGQSLKLSRSLKINRRG